MSTRHEEIVSKIILDWSKDNRGRLFKNHQGQAWTGKTHSVIGDKFALMLEYPRKITFGLAVGSSDLIGWEYISFIDLDGNTIRIPVFCSIEVKTKASPKLTMEQILWVNNIANIGGRAYTAREKDDGYFLREWDVRE